MTAARIPFPDDTVVAAALDAAPTPLQKAAQRGAMINVFRMLMHSPDLGVAVAQLGSAIFASAALTDMDRELAILAFGACFHAPYEASSTIPSPTQSVSATGSGPRSATTAGTRSASPRPSRRC